MLPAIIPVFPLPNVVLFPGVFLPLHIFEPRYREMVREALSSDRMIGMVLLKPGWEHDHEGRPAIYPVGCAGLITHVEHLAGGKYNLVLRGLEKFRIIGEEPGRAFRQAHVEPLIETLDADAREQVKTVRRRLESLIGPPLDTLGADRKLPGSMPDEDLVNALAQYLDFEPIEKQALLEKDGLLARAEALADLLEMKTLVAGSGWQGSARPQ